MADIPLEKRASCPMKPRFSEKVQKVRDLVAQPIEVNVQRLNDYRDRPNGWNIMYAV